MVSHLIDVQDPAPILVTGLLAFTADSCDDHDRRLARRFAGLVADVIVTKGMYTRHPLRIRPGAPSGPDGLGVDQADRVER